MAGLEDAQLIFNFPYIFSIFFPANRVYPSKCTDTCFETLKKNVWNSACHENYLRGNKSNSPNLTLKICSDTCPWTLSVTRSSQFSSKENCSLLETVNDREKICDHFIAPNGSYCLYIQKQRTNAATTSNKTPKTFIHSRSTNNLLQYHKLKRMLENKII